MTASAALPSATAATAGAPVLELHASDGSLITTPLPVPFITARFFPAPDWGSPVAWSVVAIQGVLGAIAHVWWYEGVHRVGASRAAIFMNSHGSCWERPSSPPRSWAGSPCSRAWG